MSLRNQLLSTKCDHTVLAAATGEAVPPDRLDVGKLHLPPVVIAESRCQTAVFLLSDEYFKKFCEGPSENRLAGRHADRKQLSKRVCHQASQRRLRED